MFCLLQREMIYMTASNTQTNITLHDIPLPYRDFLATDNSLYSFNQTFLDKEESFFINVLCYLADTFGINLSSSEADALYKHFCSMREYNKVTNLTRITDTWSALVLHYLDSLLNMLVMQNLNINLQTQTILDLGTGAGFPGIPLSIKVPKKLVLCDSVGKKTKFLSHYIEENRIDSPIYIENKRVEELSPQYNQQFTLIVTRAVARLSILLEYASPLLHNNGLLICSKAQLSEEEFQHAENISSTCGFRFVSRETFELPLHMGHREFVVYRKENEAKIKLPRNIGDAVHKPL